MKVGSFLTWILWKTHINGELYLATSSIGACKMSQTTREQELTTTVDHETDSIIQKSLRHELGEVSYLVVAHRLRTIMDFDRIMVLDEGRIVRAKSYLFFKPSTNPLHRLNLTPQ